MTIMKKEVEMTYEDKINDLYMRWEKEKSMATLLVVKLPTVAKLTSIQEVHEFFPLLYS